MMVNVDYQVLDGDPGGQLGRKGRRWYHGSIGTRGQPLKTAMVAGTDNDG